MITYVIIAVVVIILGVIGYALDKKRYEQYKREIMGGYDISDSIPSTVAQVDSVNMPGQGLAQNNQFVNPPINTVDNSEQSNQDVPVVPQ